MALSLSLRNSRSPVKYRGECLSVPHCYSVENKVIEIKIKYILSKFTRFKIVANIESGPIFCSDSLP